MTKEVFLKYYGIQTGDVVLDVGAGVGTEALTFAKLTGGTGQVLAIEAHPSTFQLLARTTALNNFRHLEVLQAAVMDSTQPVMMSDLGPELTHINRVGVEGVSVPAVTIAGLMAERQWDSIDFLKMNIEGAETAALRGAGDLIKNIRHIAVGCHDFLADESGDESYRTKSDVRHILQSAGFTVRGREDDPRPWARDYLFAHRN